MSRADRTANPADYRTWQEGRMAEAHRQFLADEWPMHLVSVYRATLLCCGLRGTELDVVVRHHIHLKEQQIKVRLTGK